MLGKKYEVYIGLKDKNTYIEQITPTEFAELLSKKCKNKNIGFSLTLQRGGYTHNQGYTTETSLRITLIGIEKEDVEEIGKSLKETINTDTIMITSEDVEYSFK